MRAYGYKKEYLLKRMSLQQVYLYYDMYLYESKGIAKKKTQEECKAEKHDYVMNMITNKIEPWDNDKEETYSWNKKMGQWEIK